MNQTVTAMGGTVFRVTLVDQSTPDVFVKQLPLRRMGELANVLGDPGSLIKLCTGKDEAFIDSLTPESFEALVDACDATNRDFFGRWLAMSQRRGRELEAVSRAAGIVIQKPVAV